MRIAHHLGDVTPPPPPPNRGAQMLAGFLLITVGLVAVYYLLELF